MNTFRTLLAAAIGVAFFAFVPANAQVLKTASPTAVAAVGPDTFSGDICGNKVNLVLKTPGVDANPELKKFFGVWKGEWSNHTCTGLAVTEVNGNIATIHYFYGGSLPPDSTVPGSFTKADAAMKGKYLNFKSMKGYDVNYEDVGGQLKGWFGNSVTTKVNLQKLK